MTQAVLGQHVGLTSLQISRLESGLQAATVDIARSVIAVLKADPDGAAYWLQELEQRQSQRTPSVKITHKIF
jgi:DNA-binding XRE family transcriptional regulator